MKRTLPLFLVATALTFTSLNTNGIYNAGAAIDKVSVVSLPDPASTALLLGLATLFMAVAGSVAGGTLVRVRAKRR